MIHPSYSDLMEIVNSGVENGEEPIINSRYSIVMATSKRARQIIDGQEPLATSKCNKPFSVAVEELYEGKVKIITDEEAVARMDELAEIEAAQELIDAEEIDFDVEEVEE